jgi:TRAP-type C4-dicarboxylate transport system substrate-binding protein
MRTILVRAACAAALLGAAAAHAQVKWNLPTAYAEGNFHTQNIKSMIEDVKQATGGKLEIALHSGASLYKMPEIKRAVQTGQVQAGEVLVSALANEDPMYELWSVPFVARGYDQVRALYQGSKPYIARRLQRDGLRLLYAAPWPYVGVFLKGAADGAEPLKGHKIRAYDKGTSQFVEMIGSTPTTVQAAEIAQAFATGIINGMVTSTTTAWDTKAWEYVSAYVDARAQYPMNMVVVNERSFRALDEPSRQALLDAAARAEERGWQRVQALVKEMDAKVADKGIRIVQPTPQMQAQFREIGRKLSAEWAQRAGPDAVELLKAAQ